jgi:hypothetical protein
LYPSFLPAHDSHTARKRSARQQEPNSKKEEKNQTAPAANSGPNEKLRTPTSIRLRADKTFPNQPDTEATEDELRQEQEANKTAAADNKYDDAQQQKKKAKVFS